MTALISLEFRESKGFSNKLRRDLRYRIYREHSTGINLIRLELYFGKGSTPRGLYKHARRAIHKLSKIGVHRAIIPDGFEFSKIIRDTGIRIVDSTPLFIKMLPKLTRHCAGELDIDMKKAVAIINGGKNRIDIVTTAMSINSDIRYLSVEAPNSEDIRREIFKESGISVLSGDVPRDLYESRIDLYLSPEEGGTILEINGYSLMTADIELALPEKYRALGPTGVVAPLLCVLSENGLISPEEISVKRVLLRGTVT